MSLLSVSVVIPLYNKAAQIERCLHSVLRQTHRQIEVVVVDDGSTDGGGQVVAALGDPRVRLVRQSNAGVSVARNRGLGEASQEWVFFLDADDEWMPNLIESLLRLHGRCPDAGVLACPTERVYADGSTSRVLLEARDFRGGSEVLLDYFATFVRLGQSPFSNSSFAVRRSAFTQAGGYTPGIRLTEDSDLWTRLALTTPMAMILPALARYHVETEGNTRKVVQIEKFEVVRTLERVLRQRLVPIAQRPGARALLRLQKLMQIRRHVLLGHRSPALRGLADVTLWRHVPTSSLVALIAALTPAAWVEGVRRFRNRSRQ